MPVSKDQKIVIAAAAAIGLLYFGVLNPVLQFLGIKETGETKELNATATDPGSAWSINFWKNIPGATLMNRVYTENLCRSIHDAFGAFNDNENQVKGIFKSLKFKTQLSWLSDVFFQLYQEDLLSFLRGGYYPFDRLSDADVQEINSYINKLPLK